jgi:hypothetical protein
MINYEWDIETTDGDGDIIDHNHRDRLNQYYKEELEDGDLVLVRTDLEGRSWAYVENGKLPEYFLDSFGVTIAKVPKRFHQELEKID